MRPLQKPINANKREIPLKENRVMISMRVSKAHIDTLKSANVNISEVVRRAIKDAVDSI